MPLYCTVLYCTVEKVIFWTEISPSSAKLFLSHLLGSEQNLAKLLSDITSPCCIWLVFNNREKADFKEKWPIIRCQYVMARVFGSLRMNCLECIPLILGGGGEEEEQIRTFRRRSEALTLCIGEICQQRHQFQLVFDNIIWQAVLCLATVAHIWNWAKLDVTKFHCEQSYLPFQKSDSIKKLNS